MFFLHAQMWLSLLIAALAGALIGWALRCRRCAQETDALIADRDAAVAETKALRNGGAGKASVDVRVAELDAQLAMERDEVAGLKAKLAALTAAGAAAGAGIVASESDSDEKSDESALEWRNRYLESRVRFLEGKLSETDQTGAAASSGAGTSAGAVGQDDDIDIARLKWRNRYLEGRLQYIEEDRNAASGGAPLTSAAATGLVAGASAFVASSPLAKEDETQAAPAKAEKPKRSKAKKSTRTSKPAKSKTTAKAASAPAPQPKIESIAGLTGAAFMAVLEKDSNYIAADKDGKPATLSAPLLGKADDLREIAGVGPKLEKLLHELGIYHFAQIAGWTDREVEWVDERLTFKGRIRRENWIAQCKLLAAGEETDGQRKYREGKHV